MPSSWNRSLIGPFCPKWFQFRPSWRAPVNQAECSVGCWGKNSGMGEVQWVFGEQLLDSVEEIKHAASQELGAVPYQRSVVGEGPLLTSTQDIVSQLGEHSFVWGSRVCGGFLEVLVRAWWGDFDKLFYEWGTESVLQGTMLFGLLVKSIGPADQLFSLSKVLEGASEFVPQKIYMYSVDLNKTFSSVAHCHSRVTGPPDTSLLGPISPSVLVWSKLLALSRIEFLDGAAALGGSI